MRYGSVCSGIEAASVAWHPLGWEPQWFSEIEHFPSAVLKHRFPDVPNLGDMTQLNQNPVFNEQPIDLLVGGTPCQSFSVAGLRKGLADPRGNLMLTFLSIADKRRPKWIVWENVPGVLSSNGGRDFGTFLSALGNIGYGFAYRVLDAQHFGVAQRRRRVFVVGYLGDWRPAAAVLFESESLQRDSKQSRKKRQETPTNAQGSVRATGFSGNVESQVAACLQTTCDDYSRADGFNTIIEQVAQPISIAENTIGRQPMNGGNGNGFTEDGPMYTLNATGIHGVAQPQYFENHPNDSRVTGPHDVGNTVSARYGTGGGNTPIVSQPIAVDWRTAQVDIEMTGTLKTDLAKMSGPCIAVDTYNYTTNEHTTQTIRSQSDTEHIGAVLEPKTVAGFLPTQGSKAQGVGYAEEQSPTLRAGCDNYGVLQTMTIRRLTPKECERLQGFPDDWTKIPYRNKSADQCPDGPRYKACGNSMAVPVMRWIGTRIQMIENYLNP